MEMEIEIEILEFIIMKFSFYLNDNFHIDLAILNFHLVIYWTQK